MTTTTHATDCKCRLLARALLALERLLNEPPNCPACKVPGYLAAAMEARNTLLADAPWHSRAFLDAIQEGDEPHLYVEESGTVGDWQPGPPEHLTVDALEIDREACAEATCQRCGHKGLAYVAEHLGRRYRCWAICPQCRATEEF